jgi:hypothetical protein
MVKIVVDDDDDAKRKTREGRECQDGLGGLGTITIAEGSALLGAKPEERSSAK